MQAGRSTSRRDKHRAIIKRDRPDCYLCGGPINYEAGFREPDSFTVDHVVPIARGGRDTLENKAAAHWGCNRDKSDHLLAGSGVTYVTGRVW